MIFVAGLAIQWGPIGDVGIYVNTIGDRQTVLGGIRPQSIASCLNTLDIFLNQSEPVVSSLIPPEKAETSADEDGESTVKSICSIIGKDLYILLF